MLIEILRLNHRIGRDPRISTHVALTARAFGASKIYYSGDKDSKLEESINKIINKFGGQFEINYVKDDVSFVKEKKEDGFIIVHLTIYGIPIQDINLIKYNKVLVLVGGEKVEPKFYSLANYNVSITDQPHSEVSAVCYFLDYYFNRKELLKEFSNAKLKIIGSEKGKILKQV